MSLNKGQESIQAQSKLFYLNSGQTFRRNLKKAKDVKCKEITYTMNSHEGNHVWANINLYEAG